jgi:hypothetical protein
MDVIKLGVDTPNNRHWLVDREKVRESGVLCLELLAEDNKVIFAWFNGWDPQRVCQKGVYVEWLGRHLASNRHDL